ncbi:hypothetical protein [Pedobacter aquatilis]|nr:hypothetical protein [Pedobacter aquatilis]
MKEHILPLLKTIVGILLVITVVHVAKFVNAKTESIRITKNH